MNGPATTTFFTSSHNGALGFSWYRDDIPLRFFLSLILEQKLDIIDTGAVTPFFVSTLRNKRNSTTWIHEAVRQDRLRLRLRNTCKNLSQFVENELYRDGFAVGNGISRADAIVVANEWDALTQSKYPHWLENQGWLSGPVPDSSNAGVLLRRTLENHLANPNTRPEALGNVCIDGVDKPELNLDDLWTYIIEVGEPAFQQACGAIPKGQQGVRLTDLYKSLYDNLFNNDPPMEKISAAELMAFAKEKRYKDCAKLFGMLHWFTEEHIDNFTAYISCSRRTSLAVDPIGRKLYYSQIKATIEGDLSSSAEYDIVDNVMLPTQEDVAATNPTQLQSILGVGKDYFAVRSAWESDPSGEPACLLIPALKKYLDLASKYIQWQTSPVETPIVVRKAVACRAVKAAAKLVLPRWITLPINIGSVVYHTARSLDSTRQRSWEVSVSIPTKRGCAS